MTEAAGRDPFEGVHLEVMGVVVGHLRADVRSETDNRDTNG